MRHLRHKNRLFLSLFKIYVVKGGKVVVKAVSD